MPIIKADNLVKKFGELTAVGGISFEIEEGEIFGLLGPNGAGKTTTISMLSTTLKPTSGTATVNGFDIRKDEDKVRKSIGIVFQDQSLDEELTAEENMDFHGRLYRIERKERQERIKKLLTLVGLEERKDGIVKTFSGGMRRRLEIARGLLHEPKVLFLDEPTLGLDPQTRNHLWQYITKLNKEKGITIILTTHYMDEADRLCRRVAIIDNGKIVAMDTPAKLKDEIGGDFITIQTSESEKLLSKIRNLAFVKHARTHEGAVKINVSSAEKHIAAIANIAAKNNILVDAISMHKPNLEDVFLHFTGKSIREEEASGKEDMRLHRRMWTRR
ncbi:MAG: ATP-binding cassette domain-containing protein [Candidatus Aenigmatarchaeota archaeon]